MVKTVFTNGCFDILHPGHIELLERARALGDKLIVGINSDSSVRSIKGADRPILDQESRKRQLLALRCVDEVYIFEELTPEKLIHNIKPNILVKGGDWAKNEIIGADYVESLGGEVVSIALVDGFSTTGLIEKLNSESGTSAQEFDDSFSEHEAVVADFKRLCRDSFVAAAELVVNTLKNGNKILICGNGGSAADAQHFAAELVCRFETERIALPSIALTTDTSGLLAIGNDYGFEHVFSRQVEALANSGDCLIGISTSGNSPNVIAAIMTARKKNCSVISLTGASGKKIAGLSDVSILVPSNRTARIQEVHLMVEHGICEFVDKAFSE